MKYAVLAVSLACLAAVGAAQAAPVELENNPPDTQLMYGQQADLSGTGALEISFNLGAGITLAEFSWWGYHLPGPSGIESFEITLNGTTVGSQLNGVATISAAPTGDTLNAPLGPRDTAELQIYKLTF